ncbi:hypothetical protein LOTGIDRAFT_164132 [Lottia gigantea]|nr:hypothetical protein LOTGIDRAFT_164132 [Lottia gigantea]ESO90544.1 hypothetical protein LOTGIDRAFT_164132 [Lottia gigantea]
MNETLLKIKDLVFNEETSHLMEADNQKIEKTEILEKTITTIHEIKRKREIAMDIVYQEGYSRCLLEINSFLSCFNLPESSRQNVLKYLTRRPHKNINLQSPTESIQCYNRLVNVDIQIQNGSINNLVWRPWI